LSDLEDLQAFLPQIDATTRPLTKANKVRQVLVLGATGNVGRWVVKHLGDLKRPTPLIIHCLVRANKMEVASARLRSSLDSLQEGLADTLMPRVRLWTGDVTKSMFGMDDTDYVKLVRRVETVYVAVGPDRRSVMREAGGDGSEAVSLYAHASATAVLYWSHVLDFAAKYRRKHIWTATPLIMSAPLLETGKHKNRLVESDGGRCEVPTSLSPHRNYLGCQSWTKGVVESLLSHARKERDMAITVCRLPPLSFYQHGDGDITSRLRSEAEPIAWSVLKVVIRTGKLPSLNDLFFSLFSHPADEAIKEMVRTFLPTYKHTYRHTYRPTETCT